VIVMIHGSAADHSTWSIQLASPLRDRFSLWSYDRRGTGATARELAVGAPPTMQQHAQDAAELARNAGEPVWLVGSSFGAVVALEVLRHHPELVRGAVLIEPPIAADDRRSDALLAFLAAFDRTVADAGGEAAAELFLRTVLGDPAFDRIPRAFRQRSMQMWRQIRADSAALSNYVPHYAELTAVQRPVLLLGGERSAPSFRVTLEALSRVVPDVRLEIVKGAGHMLHAEAHRRFAELLIEFTARG
jgi:pimeloyl-ACP methyl ester carboxylesterase